MRDGGATDGIDIREARAGDGASCASLWIEFGRTLADRMPHRFRVPPLDGLAEYFENAIAGSNPDELRLLAERDGEVVALANAEWRPASPHAPVTLVAANLSPRVVLEDIVVTERMRGRGIGERLVRRVEGWGRSRGATTCSLSSDYEGAARRFYLRLGYRSEGAIYDREL